jgi:hypothetical protein
MPNITQEKRLFRSRNDKVGSGKTHHNHLTNGMLKKYLDSKIVCLFFRFYGIL